MTSAVILAPAAHLTSAKLFTPTPKAEGRVLAFLTAQVNNDHTRKAYLNAAKRFADWCELRAVPARWPPFKPSTSLRLSE